MNVKKLASLMLAALMLTGCGQKPGSPGGSGGTSGSTAGTQIGRAHD